jgi:polyribonucleotide nucleotidyltransferase
MDEAITEPREEISNYAPRIYTVNVDKDKIRDIIGPGGKTIRSIVAQTGVKVDVEDDGRVFVASPSREAAEKALEIIENLVKEVQAGDVYIGKVTRLMPFGAFVEVLPGKEGLLHVSEISQRHVPKVDDVLQPGDSVLVIVKEIDDMGRINLSRKRILDKGDSFDEGFRDELARELEREKEIEKLPQESPGDRNSRDRDKNNGGRKGGRSGPRGSQRSSRDHGSGRNR